MGGGEVLRHLLNLLGLAAVDSVNLLAFAVIAGLWLSSNASGAPFAPRAARFTGGAYCGIVLLAAVCVWVIGANRDVVRSLFHSPWTMLVLGLVGLAIVALGLKPSSTVAEEEVEAPLAKNALQRFGIAATGVTLGIIQSGTSVPFAAGVVVISFADTPLWAQVLQILFFALVAIAPSAVLIVALSRVRSARTAAATAGINRLMARGRVLGRWLTVVVGVALVGFAAVRGAVLLHWV